MVKNSAEMGWSHWFGVAFELGWIIALPLVGFIVLGRWIDGQMGTSPLFIIGGMICAAVISVIVLIKKIGEIMKDLS